MKLLLTFIFIIVSIYASVAQRNVNFNWVQQLERQTALPVEESYFIGIDAEKNVYVAGNFHNTIDLDPGAGVTNVSSALENIFISKFNSAGKFIWGKHLGKNDKYTVCKSLSVDRKGNIYTTGYFNGVADFDPGPNSFYLSSGATTTFENNDVFISKLDANGNFQWAKQVGGNNVDIGNSINADVFGNVYTTGYITDAVDLDPGAGSFTKGSRNLITAFVIKLDGAGNFKFAKAFEGNHHSEGKFIRTDNKGNIYTSGYFGGEVDFDPGPGVYNFSTDAIFTQEDFLSKLDSSGNFVWAIRDVIGLDIAVDDEQNVYSYYSRLAKYDINGKLLWSKPVGGSPNFYYVHNVIHADPFGNIYISGGFHYTQDFDPGPLEYKLTTSGGNYASDVFVSKLDRDGNLMYARSFGGIEEDYATALAVNIEGEVYTVGVFLGRADFDPGPEEHNVTSSNFGNVFLHKMSPCKNIPHTILDIVSCKSYTLNSITYDSSGAYTQTLTTRDGCDSIIELNLQVNTITSNLSVARCTKYNWNGKSLTTSGKYTDTLQTLNGCDSIVHLDLTINRLSSLTNTTICKGQSYNGHTFAGTYTDTFHTTNGCDSLVTTHLAVLDKPAPYLGPDTTICKGDSIVLNAGSFNSYKWQDGSTQRAFIARKAGSYSVTVSNTCGTAQDEITVSEGVCKMYFPTAFTPNNDGKNDRFMLLHSYNLTDFRLTVYNRYGQQVFVTKDHTKAWMGMYKGREAEPGTYVWYCEFKEAGVARSIKGTVILLR